MVFQCGSRFHACAEALKSARVLYQDDETVSRLARVKMPVHDNEREIVIDLAGYKAIALCKILAETSYACCNILDIILTLSKHRDPSTLTCLGEASW